MEREFFFKSDQSKVLFKSMPYKKFRESTQKVQITWRCSQADRGATLFLKSNPLL
jgi:hypothetical protein